MQFSECRQGRTFIIRLEDGEIVHEEIEKFARAHSIRAAALIVVGGAESGSRLVVGPQDGSARPVVKMEHVLEDVHEIAGTGTLFPDDEGHPMLHMHMSCGRNTASVTGCIRDGVKVWQIMEVILFELLDTRATREMDARTGFKLLRP